MNQVNDKWWGPIVVIILGAIITFAGYALYTGKNLTVIEVVLTALIMKLGTMMDYRYGSSKGSRDKTDIIAGSSPDKVVAGEGQA